MSDDDKISNASAGVSGGEDKAATPELLAYLGSMAGELHSMAKRNGLTVIAALFNLVRVEAELNGDDRRKRRQAN